MPCTYPITEVHRKVSLNAYFISTNKNIFPRKIKILLYNALIRAHLEYAICIWGFGKIKCLQTLQKRVIRNINNSKHFRAHTNKLFADNGILKFEDLRELNILKLTYNILNENTPETLNNTIRENNNTGLRSENTPFIKCTWVITNRNNLLANIESLWNNKSKD